MNREPWQEVKEFLHQALEIAPEKRSAFLDQACFADRGLRGEIESCWRLTIQAGTRIGDHEIQKLIGSGGVGEVYRAHDARLRRDVAIKVLPPFVVNDRERRRFTRDSGTLEIYELDVTWK